MPALNWYPFTLSCSVFFPKRALHVRLQHTSISWWFAWVSECLNQFHTLFVMCVCVSSISVCRVRAVWKPCCFEGDPEITRKTEGTKLPSTFANFLLACEALWKKVGLQMYVQALITAGKVHSGNLNTWQMHLSAKPLRLPPAANYNYALLSW